LESPLLFFLTFCWGVSLFGTQCSEYLSDTTLFWIEWPHHSFPRAAQFYYASQLSFYILALLLLPLNPRMKYKDLPLLICHHIVTIFLISCSFYLRFQRIGWIIFLLHDCSDILLEGTKLLHYLGLDAIGYVTFGIFTLTFMITRCFLFPRVVYSVWSETTTLLMTDDRYLFRFGFLCLLIPLQIMNIIWSCLILSMIINGVRKGSIDDDCRSDDEQPVTKEKKQQ